MGVGFLRGPALLPFYADSWQEATLNFYRFIIYVDFWQVTFTVLPSVFTIQFCFGALRAHLARHVVPRHLVHISGRCTHQSPCHRPRPKPPPAPDPPSRVVVIRVDIDGPATSCAAASRAGDFYRFMRLLHHGALLPFYTKTRSLLPNPHPMSLALPLSLDTALLKD